MSKKKKVLKLPVGKEIVAPKLRVVNENGDQLGIMSLQDGLDRASMVNLELVEMCSTVVPPVCKIMDYKKFRYQQQKMAKGSRKKQVNISVKEIRIRPHIKEHDLTVKVKSIQKFLNNSDRVKLAIVFRGRELGYKSLGMEILDNILNRLKDLGSPERPPSMEGRFLVTFLIPNKKGKKNA